MDAEEAARKRRRILIKDSDKKESRLKTLYKLICTSELGQIIVCEAAQQELSKLEQKSAWSKVGSGSVVALSSPVESHISQKGGAWIATARENGSCEIWSVAESRIVGKVPPSMRGKEGDTKIMSLHLLTRHILAGDSQLPMLLCCSASGLIRTLHAPENGGLHWEESSAFEVTKNLLATAVDEEEKQLAVGCEGKELNVWSLQSQELSFQFKAPKPDRLGLQPKPWVTAVAFLPGSSGQKLVAGTGQHSLRLYSLSQKKPLLVADFGEGRVTSLAPEKSGSRCWASDTRGRVQCLDLRLGKVLGVLKGTTGSIRALHLHDEQPFIASVGLDRYLRIHHTTTRQMLAQVYLKQNLTGVAFLPDQEVEQEAKQRRHEAAEEEPLSEGENSSDPESKVEEEDDSEAADVRDGSLQPTSSNSAAETGSILGDDDDDDDDEDNSESSSSGKEARELMASDFARKQTRNPVVLRRSRGKHHSN